VTLAETGTEIFNCCFEGDPKICLTAIATIDAAGGKLPMWIIYQSKTERCERRYRKDEGLRTVVRQSDFVLSHEESGWTTAQMACQYLQWLNRWYRGKPITLLWDLSAFYRCSEAQELAPQLNIRLEFIPAGATGDYQPLDRRIFGNLKSRTRSRFD
jgi:hypothetical protein